MYFAYIYLVFKYSFWYLFVLYVNLPVKSQTFGKNDILSILAYFGGQVFCNHSNGKRQINTQSKQLNISSNKTARRKCTVTFIFRPLRGARNGLNAHPSLLSLPMTVSVLSQDLSGHFVVVVVGGIVVVPK